jgi:hypothetical protein
MTTDHKATHNHDQEDWRELARQIQAEKNPQKMIELVQQLIAKYEEQQARKSPPSKAETPKPSGSPEA